MNKNIISIDKERILFQKYTDHVTNYLKIKNNSKNDILGKLENILIIIALQKFKAMIKKDKKLLKDSMQKEIRLLTYIKQINK